MRLLAYGGTGYYERQRIGAWDSAPRDALDDSFRLEEKDLTFGLGLIEQTPILVVRQLQVTRTGRAYAYSLLLDPGPQVWERFAWDAAALTSALFEENEGIGRLLLEQPEKLNAQQLESVIEGLSAKEDSQGARLIASVTDSQSAWIGACLMNATSSWRPQVFGFAERPEANQVSLLIGNLPICFRAGRGWLIGGSGQSARSFGAQFSVDERSDTDVTTADLAQAGRELFTALQTLASDEQFADLAILLLQRPMWEWPGNGAEDPAVMADRLKLIAQLLRPTDIQDDTLQLVIETLSVTEFLQLELRRAWQRAVAQTREPLTPEETSFALENYFDHGLPLNSEALSRMDADTLANRFVVEGLEPSNLNTPNLPALIRQRVWIELLRQTASEDVPGIFFRALEDLTAEEDDLAATLYQELKARMTSEKSRALIPWQRHAHRPHWAVVKPLLCEQARARAGAHERDWPFDYLLFAEDDGANWLLSQPTTKRDWKELVRLFVSLVQSDHPYAETARRWLQELAGSGIRTMQVLDSEEKLLIGSTVRGDWISYIDLVDAYSNQVEFFRPARHPSERDRSILLKELEDLIREKPARDFVPDINGLEAMLGPLPSKTMAYFQDLTPEFSKPSDATKWVSAWGSRDPRRASRETVRYFLESDGGADSEYWLKPEFEEQELENLFNTLMFRDHPLREKRYQKRFKELLLKTQAQRAKRIFRVVNRLFKEGIESDGQARVFCNRFSDDRETLEILFSFLPRTTSGLALTDALYKDDPAHFVNEAHSVWKIVVRKVKALDPYQYALMYDLSKRKAHRQQVARKLEDLFPGELINLRLEEILQRGANVELISEQLVLPEESPKTVPERRSQAGQVDVYESKQPGLGAKLKAFLGFGNATQSRNEDEPDNDQ